MAGDCARRDLILEMAGKLFNKLGYENTSIRKIAEAAGGGKASLYYYFKSKEEIFLTILEKEGEEYFVKHQLNKDVTDNQLNKLRDYLMIPSLLFRKHSSLMIKMFFNLHKLVLQKSLKRITEMQQIFYEIFKDILNRGIASEEIREDLDVERFMTIFFMNMNGLLFLSYPKEIQPKNLDDRVGNFELMLDIMIEGIRRK